MPPKKNNNPSLTQRVAALEEKVDAREKDLNEIKRCLNDLKRQYSKQGVVMYGDSLPPRSPRENCLTIFREQTARKFNISINVEEVAVCHRRQNGSLIAKFTKFGPGSSFERLVKRHENWNPKPNIKIYVTILLTRYDDKIRFYLSKAKKCGTISNYRVERSGRVSILRKEAEGYKPVNTFEEIGDVLTEEVMTEVGKANTQRDKRRAANSDEATDQKDEQTNGEGNHEDPDDEDSLLGIGGTASSIQRAMVTE